MLLSIIEDLASAASLIMFLFALLLWAGLLSAGV